MVVFTNFTVNEVLCTDLLREPKNEHGNTETKERTRLYTYELYLNNSSTRISYRRGSLLYRP